MSFGANGFLTSPRTRGLMTDLLWMPASDGDKDTGANPNYVRSFDATVKKATEEWLMLDRTAFYAEGGGQPSDVGTLTWDGGEAQVKHVSKRGLVKHEFSGDAPPAGALVHGEIDWALRHQHMRMHTSQHILSGVMWHLHQARTAGNQIKASRSRVDFDPLDVDDEALRAVQDEVNRVLSSDLPIRVYDAPRADLEARLAADAHNDRNLLGLVPQSVKVLRVVEVYDPENRVADYGGTVDFCPCAGTHVARTGEIGSMEIIGKESKGAGKQRVRYVLKDGRQEVEHASA